MTAPRTSGARIVCRKLGFRLSPAAIVLQYELPPEGGSKVKRARQRTMPVRNLTATCRLPPVVEELRQRHNEHLENVPALKIERILRILQELMKGSTLEESIETADNEFSINPEEDLNRVDDDTLRRKKELMEKAFEDNRKRPGDLDFEYDIMKEFEPIESSAWDSENEQFEF